MGEKYEVSKPKPFGPGPDKYDLPDPNVNHEQNPIWTIKGKIFDQKSTHLVGPGEYEATVLKSTAIP